MHIVTDIKKSNQKQTVSDMHICFVEQEEPVKQRLQKYLQKQSTVNIRWMEVPVGNVRCARQLAAGTSMNVIEIDAASNNGVDNIREIREEVAYRPTEGKYKVYIIDEVHMLSIGAFQCTC